MDGKATGEQTQQEPAAVGRDHRPANYSVLAVANNSSTGNDCAAPSPISVGSLLHDDDVRNWLLAWSVTGHRCALVTVIAVEGGAPRSVGAQMAVSDSGQYAGYLSGGCLEQAVALEALAALRQGRNRRVRYGAGSKYVDIRLPCGSAIDVYIDQSLDLTLIRQLADLRDARRVGALQTELRTGQTTIVSLEGSDVVPGSRLEGEMFSRAYIPTVKLQLIGAGPSLISIAKLAVAAGLPVEVASPNEETLNALKHFGVTFINIHGPKLPELFLQDRWTAVVLAFHEHVWEPPIIRQLLATPVYYIGAIGSRTVHAERLRLLAEQGIAERDLSRIRGPIGLVPGAKSSASLAVGVVAEIMAEAKTRNFIA